MHITHINASDISGGAARAANRIHKSLLKYHTLDNFDSKMRVIHKLSDDQTIQGGPPCKQNSYWRVLRPRLNRLIFKGFKSNNTVLHSAAWLSTGLGVEMNEKYMSGELDLIHIHWLGDETLSISEIGNMKMPIVWTLHDQWAFCGAEHYTNLQSSINSPERTERYINGYTRDNRPVEEFGKDLNRITWLKKKHAWHKSGFNPIHIVCPSQWMADCAKSSALMKDWPIEVIPNPIDLRIWSPYCKREARNLLNLPINKLIILFGAIGGTTDFRKGSDLLLESLHHLKSQLQGTDFEDLELVIFGQSEPTLHPIHGFKVNYMGNLNDNISLRLLYTAADLMVIPSRQDNLPNTGLEAQACGTPVVAFQTGGLQEIIEDRITGALAKPFDPFSLAHCMRWAISNPERMEKLGDQARKRAEYLWNPIRIAKLYCGLYEKINKQ